MHKAALKILYLTILVGILEDEILYHPNHFRIQLSPRDFRVSFGYPVYCALGVGGDCEHGESNTGIAIFLLSLLPSLSSFKESQNL